MTCYPRRVTLLRLVLLLVPALLGASCVTGSQTIDGSDYHVRFPAARVNIDLKRAAGRDEDARGFCVLTLEATRALGSSTQELGPGDSQRFKGVDFSGPDSLDVRFELDVFNLWFALGDEVAPGVRVSAMAGIAAIERDLELTGASAHVKDADLFLLPTLGAEVGYEPIEHARLYARYLLACDTEDDLAPALRMFEGGLRVQPQRNLALFAGWRDWRYDEERVFESNVDLDIEGTLLGFELCF